MDPPKPQPPQRPRSAASSRPRSAARRAVARYVEIKEDDGPAAFLMPEVQCFSRQVSAATDVSRQVSPATPTANPFSRQVSAASGWSRQVSRPGSAVNDWTRQVSRPGSAGSAVNDWSRQVSYNYERQTSPLSVDQTLYSPSDLAAPLPSEEVTELVRAAVQRCCETGEAAELREAQKTLDRELKMGGLHFEALLAGMRSPCMTEYADEVERVVVRTSSSGTEHVQYRYRRKLANVKCFEWLCGTMVARFGTEPGRVVDAILAVDGVKASFRKEIPVEGGEKKHRRDEITVDGKSARAVKSWMEWLLDSALHAFACRDVSDEEFERLIFQLDLGQIPPGHLSALTNDAQVRLVDKVIRLCNVKWFTIARLGALRGDAGLAAASYLLPRTATLRRDVANAAAAAAMVCG